MYFLLITITTDKFIIIDKCIFINKFIFTNNINIYKIKKMEINYDTLTIVFVIIGIFFVLGATGYGISILVKEHGGGGGSGSGYSGRGGGGGAR